MAGGRAVDGAAVLNHIAAKLRVLEGKVATISARLERVFVVLEHSKLEEDGASWLAALQADAGVGTVVLQELGRPIGRIIGKVAAMKAQAGVGPERQQVADGDEQTKFVSFGKKEDGKGDGAMHGPRLPVHRPYGGTPSTALPSPHPLDYEIVYEAGEDTAVGCSSAADWGMRAGWMSSGARPRG